MSFSVRFDHDEFVAETQATIAKGDAVRAMLPPLLKPVGVPLIVAMQASLRWSLRAAERMHEKREGGR